MSPVKVITQESLSTMAAVEPLKFEFARKKIMRSQILLQAGLLHTLDWKNIIPRNEHTAHFIITDKTVDSLYGNALLQNISHAGYSVKRIIVHPGERAKSLNVYENLIRTILASGITKHSYIIGFGGGVVNNIAGFVASTLYRGIGLIQFPTTLLAQVDAAIDFKQGINSGLGKNHLGSYYPATCIAIDPLLLQTLPTRHVRNGLAEIIKHAITQDRTLFNYLLNEGIETNLSFYDTIIAHTIQLKTSLLDESFSAEYSEMVPQYGHAIGHALEHLSHYTLLHGEALGIGMCVMAEIAMDLGICNETVPANHYKILQKFFLPTKIPKKISNQTLLNTLRHDKHYTETIHSVLVSRIGCVGKNGQSWSFPIDPDIITRAFVHNQERIVKKYKGDENK